MEKTNDSTKTKLTIMSYNIQMIPVPLNVSVNTWFREKALIEYIIYLDKIYNIDVLILNEVFTKRIYRLLKENLTKTQFPFYTDVLGNKLIGTNDLKKNNKSYERETNDTNYSNDSKKLMNLAPKITKKGREKDTKHLKEKYGLDSGIKENMKKTDLNSFQLLEYSDSTISKLYNFETVTGKVNFYTILNGGVMVFLKHKIITLHALIFSNSISHDKFCSKGAIFLKCLVNEKHVNIIATHLQAGDRIREQMTRVKQVEELSNWIKYGNISKYISNDEPLFYVGDFNIRYKNDIHYLDIIMSEKYLNSYLTQDDLETTYDTELNEYCHYIYPSRYVQNTLDYIFISKHKSVEILTPQTSIQTKFKPIRFMAFWLYLFPYKLTKVYHTSDHFPIYAIFII